MDVPATLRAARRLRQLSQRDLADIAKVPRSTVDRIEAGVSNPRVGTLDALLNAVGLELAVHVGGTLLTIDAEREQLCDFAGRHFPAHWEARPVEWLDGWWGWWRKRPGVRSYPPTHTYWKRYPHVDTWMDAT